MGVQPSGAARQTAPRADVLRMVSNKLIRARMKTLEKRVFRSTCAPAKPPLVPPPRVSRAQSRLFVNLHRLLIAQTPSIAYCFTDGAL